MPKRIYSQAFKKKAVALIVKQGMTYKKAAKESGVSLKSMRDWVMLMHPNFKRRDKPRQKPRLNNFKINEKESDTPVQTDIRTLIETFKIENDFLQKENEVLLRIIKRSAF